MIHIDKLRIGNWISLKLAGSLIAAHRIVDKDQLSIVIVDSAEYKLSKTDGIWTYLREPKTRSLFPHGIKGIPLSTQILNDCGFLPTTLLQDSSEKNYYSLGDFSVISYGPIRTCAFTDKSGNIAIQFVHELQNLFFNSVHKELDITVPAYNYQLLSK